MFADPILSVLKPQLLAFVEDQLTNNDVSSDDELKGHFMVSGLTELQAAQALRFRDLYMGWMYLEGHTPILKGCFALRFDPHKVMFGIVRS